MAQLRFTGTAQQLTDGEGLLVPPLTHQGCDHQQPDPGPLGIRQRSGFRQRGQLFQALAVVTAFQRGFSDREVQRSRLLVHASAASHHHGADAGIGEHFQQQSMGHPSIDDVSRRNPLRQGPDAALRLGGHPTGHNALIDELTRL